MPRKEGMKPIHILVQDEQRQKINAFAAKRGFKMTSDYIRSLIQKDMRDLGEDIELNDVDRGGYRGGPKKE